MTHIKICGLTTEESLRSAAENGADFIGLVFYPPSPRAVMTDQAAALAKTIRHIPASARPQLTGLFVNADDALIADVLNHVPLDLLQLHGDEPPQRCRDVRTQFDLPVMKAIPVATQDDLKHLAAYQDACNWILFDTKSGNSAEKGGTGQCFDWALLSDIRHTTPWMLAGGLNRDNITDALQRLSPDAVDVSSGVEEQRGVKNSAMIKEFIETVRQSD